MESETTDDGGLLYLYVGKSGSREVFRKWAKARCKMDSQQQRALWHVHSTGNEGEMYVLERIVPASSEGVLYDMIPYVWKSMINTCIIMYTEFIIYYEHGEKHENKS